MVTAEVSQELADFLKVERAEACAILAYLASSPTMWKEALAVAELRLGIVDPIGTYGGAEESVIKRERRRVNEFLKLTRFGYCDRCFFPVIHYANDTTLDWPPRGNHECLPGEQQMNEEMVMRPKPGLAVVTRIPNGEPRRFRG